MPQPVPAVSVALLRGDRVLLVRRGREPARGLYAFPGGRVEEGETLEQAARRELLEETGMQAGPLTPVVELVIPGEDNGPGFRLQVFSGPALPGEPLAGSDADEAAFFTLSELAALPLTDDIHATAARLLEMPDNQAIEVKNALPPTN